MRCKKSNGISWKMRLLFLLILLQLTTWSLADNITPAKYVFYPTEYYNIYYKDNDKSGLSYAKGLEPYLSKAYNAALSVIGFDYRNPDQQGKLNIKLYNSQDGAYGYMAPSKTAIGSTVFLNTYYLKDQSYGAWGNTVAHETAHIMFFNYTNAGKWNPGLWNYTTYLTEALSWYAADCVYGWADRKTSSTISASYIRSQIKFYSNVFNKNFSWYDTGLAYADPHSQVDLSFSAWNLRAIGSFLTDDLRTGTAPKVKTLLTTLRNNEASLSNQSFSESKNSIAKFEDAFKTAYGKYANSAWQFTGPRGPKADTTYLYGDYYKQFYK